MQGMGYSEYGFSQQGVGRGTAVGTGNGLGRGFCVTMGSSSFSHAGHVREEVFRCVEGGPQYRASSVSSYPSGSFSPVVEQKLFHTRECFKVWVRTSPLRTKKTTAHETMKIFFNFNYMFP